AEDGIRDRNVTGVQTCALPISNPFTPPLLVPYGIELLPPSTPAPLPISTISPSPAGIITRAQARATRKLPTTLTSSTLRKDSSRSEERRVGKEWRRKRGRDHET